VASLKHSKRLRWSRVACGPALALLVAATAAGCTSPPAATTSTGTSTGAGRATPALTTTQARGIFDSYVAANVKAAQTNDSALALSVVTGTQHSTLEAMVNHGESVCSAPSSSGEGCIYRKPQYDQYAYGTPAIYLPEPAGYPRFFVADATQTLKGTAPTLGMAPTDGTTWVAGAEVPLDGDVLMVFEQASATATWQVASISQLASGMALPRLATDKNGYVPQVPLSATSLLARPDVTGPLQAAVVDDGPTSVAAKAVAAGPLTTGIYQGALDHVTGLSAPPGDLYQWNLEGSPYPAFALRTASGGALVLYAMYLNSLVQASGATSKASPVQSRLPIAVPPNFLPLLPKGKATPTKSLETQQLLSFAAIDPPVGSAKVTVIAIGGGPNYASASLA
jgi:hypothetical protein